MDDNVKNVDNGSASEKPQRNNNNRNRNRNRNRNYNKNYSKSNKPADGENAENSQNAQASNGSNKPRNNNRYNSSGKPRYNKNYNNKPRAAENSEVKAADAEGNAEISVSENTGEVRKTENRNYNKNRNKNRNRNGERRENSGGTKPKGYYMSKPADSDETFGYDDVEKEKLSEVVSENNQNDGKLSVDEFIENFEEKKPAEKKAAVQGGKPKKKKPAADRENSDVTELTEVDDVEKPVKKAKADASEKAVKKTKADASEKPVKKIKADASEKPVKKIKADASEKPVKKANADASEKPVKKAKTDKPVKSEKTEDWERKKSAKKSKSSKAKEAAAIAAAAAVQAEKRSKSTAEKSAESKNKAKTSKAAKTAESKSENTASARRRERVKDDPNSAENRKKSETRFWVRMFSLMVIVPVYLALVICMIAMPRSTISNIEKRKLDTFPEFSWSDYWSGTYTASITHYFDDTVPFRDTLKQAGSQLLNFLGIKYNNVQVTGQMQVVNNQDTDNSNASDNTDSGKKSNNSVNTSSKAEDTDSEEEVTPKGQEIADGVYTNGVIVVYQDNHYRGMTMYGGGTGDVYVDSVNKFAQDLPGVKVYSMVDPTSSEFYTPLNFSEYNASQSDDIESINSRLQNVRGINVCPVLAKHVNETIYTRTDHHWMSLGAYYAAQTFAKEAGVPFKDIKDYQKKSVPGYVGTLYTFSDNNANLLNDPEDFIYYVPKNKNYTVEYYDYSYNFVTEGDMFVEVSDNSEMYCTFIYGDIYTVKISTGVKNGRKLCLVKDSYGDAIPPFLTGSFEEIYVVDMRYFELNLVDFVKEQGITDLLFSCCSYSAVGPNADNLEVLRTMGGSSPSNDDDDDEDDFDSTSSEEADDSNNVDNDISNDIAVNDNNDDDFFDNINVDDGQLGFVGNINDDDYSYDDYDYDDYY